MLKEALGRRTSYVNFADGCSFYPVNPSGASCFGGLSGIDVEDTNLGIGAIPVGGDGVEDKPKILFGTGAEGGCGDRLHIYIGFTGADELER